MKKHIHIKIPGVTFLETWKNKIKEKMSGLKEKAEQKMKSDEMLSLSEKLRPYRTKEQLRTIVIVASVMLALTGVIVYSRLRVYDGYRVVSSVERLDDAATTYVRLKNRILKCNPNGVTCVNDSNEVQWNVTFTMQNPIVDICDSKVVVGDQRGNEIHVFDKNGEIGHFEVEHTLTKVRVANQGVVAAVLEDGMSSWINIYDVKGTLLVKNKTSMSESGYPVDIDLSSDGKKMIVSYLGINDSNVRTRVAFYNFSAVGQGEANYLVNSVEYEGTVVPEVSFLENHYAVAFRDDGIVFFKGKQIPEECQEVILQEEIVSAFHDKEYVGVITAAEEEQVQKYKMQIFRANGSRCGVKYFDQEYSDISISGEEILMHNTTQIEIYDVKGKKKASIKYEKPIIDIMKISGMRRYDVFTNESTDRITIK